MSKVDMIDIYVKDSSSVRSASYFVNDREMLVEFQTYSTYLYKDVPKEVFMELLNSEEFGKDFNRIKKDYDFVKIEQE
jgi:hypothetical protein